MIIKQEKGIVGTDIAISVIIITIFIAIIGNLIININLNAKDTQRKTIATSYATQEIEKIKAQGYIQDYENKGINEQDILEDKDILEENGQAFTGFHKKVIIQDYVLIQNDKTKKENLVKEIIVEISYKVGNQNKTITFSTYVSKNINQL